MKRSCPQSKMESLEQDLDAKLIDIEDEVRALRDQITKDLKKLNDKVEHEVNKFYDKIDVMAPSEGKHKRRMLVKLQAVESDRQQVLHKTSLLVEVMLSNRAVSMKRQPSLDEEEV